MFAFLGSFVAMKCWCDSKTTFGHISDLVGRVLVPVTQKGFFWCIDNIVE